MADDPMTDWIEALLNASGWPDVRRLTLGENAAVTMAQRPGGWRLGIEHRDDASQPWEEADGAWLNGLDRLQMQCIVGLLTAELRRDERAA